jgi:NAD(P)-dependent dehydrogenase (short-subunit alcohol dehydrogenase family)
MDGKVIVVTGASGALGRVVVDSAIARGARVAAVDHAAKPQPAEGPRQLEIGGVDLADAAQAKKAIDAVAAHFGRLDALINVAGGFVYETIADGDAQAEPNRNWEKMHRLNLLTALNASRSSIPHLIKSRAGRIVNIGAMGALHAGAGRIQGRRASPHRDARRRIQGQGDRQCRLALDHRHPGEPDQHAGRRLRQMGDAGRTGQCHPVSRQR